MIMNDESNVTTREESGCLVVLLTEPRVTEGPVLDSVLAVLDEAGRNAATARVAIDFQHVELMSSGVIGGLVRFYRQLAEHGGRVVLCGVRPPVASVLKVTRLDQLFQLEPDVASGVQWLNR